MRVIHKYTIPADGLRAPHGDVRLIAYQGDSSELPTVWIEHDIGETGIDEYFFRASGTEFSAYTGHEFAGSAQCGRFVWHVFRRRFS